MIKRLVFGGAVIESIPANVGLAILRVFVGLSMALGHGLGKIPPSERFVAIIENFGVSVARVFCLDGSLFGVWRRAIVGTGITHATRGVFDMLYHAGGRVLTTRSGSIQHEGDGISVPGYYRDVCGYRFGKIRGRYSDTIA